MCIFLCTDTEFCACVCVPTRPVETVARYTPPCSRADETARHSIRDTREHAPSRAAVVTGRVHGRVNQRPVNTGIVFPALTKATAAPRRMYSRQANSHNTLCALVATNAAVPKLFVIPCTLFILRMSFLAFQDSASVSTLCLGRSHTLTPRPT